MVIRFDAVQDPYGLARAGSILGEALMQRNLQDRGIQLKRDEEDRKSKLLQQQGSILGQTMRELREQNPTATEEDIFSAFLSKEGANPELGLQYLESMSKVNASRIRTDKKSGAAGVLQKRSDEMIANTIEDLPKIQGSRTNLNRMKELAPSLSGVTGFAKGYLNTQEAAEFNALGLASIEPILKIFNPRGSIPQAKIEMIKKVFAPSAFDMESTMQGKFNALESFIEQGEKKAEKFQNLLEKYGTDIPPEELIKYEKEVNSFLDESLKSRGVKDANSDGLMDRPPSAKEFSGRTIVNPKTGEKLKSDGTKWVKVKG